MVRFCSLKALSTDGLNEYGGTLSVTLELKIHAPDFSEPSQRAINHSYLPNFCQNSVFTWPVSTCFYLRYVAEFQNFKF